MWRRQREEQGEEDRVEGVEWYANQVNHVVYLSLKHGGGAGLSGGQGEAGHGVVLPVSQGLIITKAKLITYF